jgi:hypothetical protein
MTTPDQAKKHAKILRKQGVRDDNAGRPQKSSHNLQGI